MTQQIFSWRLSANRNITNPCINIYIYLHLWLIILVNQPHSGKNSIRDACNPQPENTMALDAIRYEGLSENVRKKKYQNKTV